MAEHEAVSGGFGPIGESNTVQNVSLSVVLLLLAVSGQTPAWVEAISSRLRGQVGGG